MNPVSKILNSLRFCSRILFFLVLINLNYDLSKASPGGGLCPQNENVVLTNGAREFSKPKAAIFVVQEDLKFNDQEENKLPEEWDWRSVNGSNWLTSVKQQISCGDCVMHAVASVFESQLKINSLWPWWEPELSINEGFHCGGGVCSQGWNAVEAIQRGQQFGFLDDYCGKEINTKDSCELKKCSPEKETRWKINHAIKINDGTLDVQAIRRALQYGPVLSGMTIPEDFSCYRWGVYRKGKNVNFLNVGHMLAIVGYSNKKKAWIVKNSWGENWIDKGFGYLYVNDTTGFGTHAWSLIPENGKNLVEVEGIKNRDVLSGKIKLTLNQLDKTSSNVLELEITQNQNKVLSKSCMGPLCSIELDTLQIPDGQYEIRASNSNLKTTSLFKSLQIANSKPNWDPLKKMPLLSLSSNTQSEMGFTIPFKILPQKLKLVFILK